MQTNSNVFRLSFSKSTSRFRDCQLSCPSYLIESTRLWLQPPSTHQLLTSNSLINCLSNKNKPKKSRCIQITQMKSQKVTFTWKMGFLLKRNSYQKKKSRTLKEILLAQSLQVKRRRPHKPQPEDKNGMLITSQNIYSLTTMGSSRSQRKA